MEKTENLSVHISRKSGVPQLTRRPTDSGTVSPPNQERPKRTNSSAKEKSGKAEEGAKVPRASSQKRPSTASDSQRKKAPDRERTRVSTPIPKPLSKPPKTIGGAPQTAPISKKPRPPPLPKHHIPFPEGVEANSLLALAVQEEGQIVKMLKVARERLRKKLFEKSRPRSKSRDLMGDCFVLLGESFSAHRDLSGFKDSYGGTLEEVLQVWMNLLYFVVNLRINLIRVLQAAGTERFEANVEKEKRVLTQAVECVKFFSRLKLKSVSNLSEGIHCTESDSAEVQLKEYEEKISTPFLNDFSFMDQKAKQLLQQIHDKNNSKFL